MVTVWSHRVDAKVEKLSLAATSDVNFVRVTFAMNALIILCCKPRHKPTGIWLCIFVYPGRLSKQSQFNKANKLDNERINATLFEVPR